MKRITHIQLMLSSRTQGTLSPLTHIIKTRCLLKYMNRLPFYIAHVLINLLQIRSWW